jgi:hypothetical protein
MRRNPESKRMQNCRFSTIGVDPEDSSSDLRRSRAEISHDCNNGGGLAETGRRWSEVNIGNCHGKFRRRTEADR